MDNMNKYLPHVLSVVILGALYLLHQHGITIEEIGAASGKIDQCIAGIEELAADIAGSES